MYQAGEFIVYGTNSVCRVESIGKPPFETEEDKLYYTLVPVTGTETIYIPTDSPVFTRPVISREKAEELINSIPDIEEDHFVCHSVRMANEHYQAALQSHDADPLAELLDHVSISKWNWNAESTDLLLKAEGVVSNNGTKGNPCLSGDILGDWREEVIWASEDQTELRIYSTTIPAVDRRATWMNDRQYRLAIAWQNVAYNQPPHPSF